MKILGIHDGQDASVALVIDGQLVDFAREARYRRPGEYAGFPRRALRRILSANSVKPEEIDAISLAGHAMKVPRSRRELLKQFQEESGFGDVARTALSYVIPGAFRTELRKKDRLELLSAAGLESSKASFVDAHLAASMVAYNYRPGMDRRCLVLCAGSGIDRMAATVHVAQHGKLERIATIHEEDSLGALCEHVTYLLGMSPQRDESLLMDLGAQTQGPLAASVQKRFEILFEFDEMLPLNWQRASNLPETQRCHEFLRKHLRRRRFDHIAGGFYQFLCDFVAEWVGRCAHKTEIRDVLLCGDLFELGALVTAASRRREVVSVAASPLPGSAGNAIGAALLVAAEREDKGYQSVSAMNEPYSGECPDFEVIAKIMTGLAQDHDVVVERPENIAARAADLLAAGAVLARIAGPHDLRVLGLGNRSLIARSDHAPAREKLREILFPDTFWESQRFLWKAESLRSSFLEADTLAEAPCGEFHLTPRVAGPWYGLSPNIKVPIQSISKFANPDCWELLDAFQQVLPATPLLTGPWRQANGTLVRSVHSALRQWKAQNLDALIMGDWLVFRSDF